MCVRTEGTPPLLVPVDSKCSNPVCVGWPVDLVALETVRADAERAGPFQESTNMRVVGLLSVRITSLSDCCWLVKG
jgi:hypothetical protein